MEKEKIARINELARRQREAGLTEDEAAEQKLLRLVDHMQLLLGDPLAVGEARRQARKGQLAPCRKVKLV